MADFRAINPDLELYIITSPYAVKEPYNANLTNDIIPMQKALAQESYEALFDNLDGNYIDSLLAQFEEDD